MFNKLYEELFDRVNLIQCTKLRCLCKSVINTGKDQIRQPSSSSGMHHPDDEYCIGGQIIHVLKVVNLSLHALRRRNNILNRYIVDIVITNAILHDLPLKFKLEEDGIPLTPTMNRKHGYDNAEYIRTICEQLNIDINTTENIYYPICFHMGKWMPEVPFLFPNSELKKQLLEILQEADYYSSRKNVSIDYNIDYTGYLIDEILQK